MSARRDCRCVRDEACFCLPLTSADMPLIHQDVPNRLSDLALYASLVATAVITLNVLLVKLARKISFRRSRSRPVLRWELPER